LKLDNRHVWYTHILSKDGGKAVSWRYFSFFVGVQSPNPKKQKTWFMGHHPGVDYNLTLRPLSRLQHIYHRQPYASVDSIPRSGTLDLASEGVWWPRIFLSCKQWPNGGGQVSLEATDV
jgi:hypothetical protein